MKKRLFTSLVFGTIVTIIYLCIHQYVIEKKKKNGAFEIEKIGHPQKYNAQLLLAIDKTANPKAPSLDDLEMIKEKLEKKARFLDEDAIFSLNDDYDFQIKLSQIEDTAGLEDFFTKAYSAQFWEMYTYADLPELINTLRKIDEKIFTISYENNTVGKLPPAELAYIKPADTTAARKIISNDSLKKLIPADALLMFGKTNDEKIFALYAIKTRGYNDAPVNEKDIKEAHEDFTNTGQAEVNIQFNKSGTNKWYMLTKMNVNRYIAIAVNNFILSAPHVLSEIEGGHASITGSFSVEEASNLAFQLKIGSLPRPIRLIEKKITDIKPPFFYRAKDVLIPLLVLVLFTFLGYQLLGLIKLPENSTL
jgi:hypothetical protein